MRILPLLALLLLSACAVTAPQWHGGLTGIDCSMVRLQQGRPYCNVHEPPPAPPPFCTRSLGSVDCWANPQALNGSHTEVADGPRTLTEEQERLRTGGLPLF